MSILPASPAAPKLAALALLAVLSCAPLPTRAAETPAAPPTPSVPADASASRLDALPRVPPEFAASEDSIRRLLAVSDAQAMVASALQRAESMLRMPTQGPDGKPLPPGAAALFADVRSQLVDLLRQRLRWDRLEAMYVEIYRRTFTQSDVDGIIAFYESPAGVALRAKMPTVQAWLMETMQAEMQAMAPELQRIQRDALKRLQESDVRS